VTLSPHASRFSQVKPFSSRSIRLIALLHSSTPIFSVQFVTGGSTILVREVKTTFLKDVVATLHSLAVDGRLPATVMNITGDDNAIGEIQIDIVVLAGPCKLIHLSVESELPEKQPHKEHAADLAIVAERVAECAWPLQSISDGEILERVEVRHRLVAADIRELRSAKLEVRDFLEYVPSGGGLVRDMSEWKIVELEGQEWNEQCYGESSGTYQRALVHEDACAGLVSSSHGPIYCQVGSLSSVEVLEIR
jgi:hypothetical protein